MNNTNLHPISHRLPLSCSNCSNYIAFNSGCLSLANSFSATSENIARSYILCRTVSKLLQIVGQIFAFDRGVPVFITLLRGEPLNLGPRNLASRNYKHRSIMWYEKYFDILNRLGVAHECDGHGTDGRTDRQNRR